MTHTELSQVPKAFEILENMGVLFHLTIWGIACNFLSKSGYVMKFQRSNVITILILTPFILQGKVIHMGHIGSDI